MKSFIVFNIEPVIWTFIALLVLYALVALFVFVYIRYDKQRIALGKTEAFKSNRVFIVNTKEETVDFFDFNNLKKIETISYIEFLEKFTDVEQNRVKTFIRQILLTDSNFFDSSRTLVTNVVLNVGNKKVSYRAIIFAKEVDKENGLVYIEIYRLAHTPQETRLSRRGVFHDVYEPSVIRKLYNEGRYSHGTFHFIKFAYKSNAVPFMNNNVVSRLLIDSFYTVINNNQSAVFVIKEEQGNCIVDERQMNDLQLSKFTSDLTKTIDRFLELNGLSTIFTFFIGSAKIGDLPHGFDDALNAMSGLVKGGEAINRKLSTYKREGNNSYSVESIYEIEMKRLVREKSFDVTFAPIVHVTNSKSSLCGYFARVNPQSKLIATYFEAVKYAKEFGCKDEFVSLVVKHAIPSFTSQCEAFGNIKLLMRLSINDVEAAIEVLKTLPKAENVKIDFVFRSYEFLDSDKNSEYLDLIDRIRKMGYEVGLFIKQTDYVLSEKIYKIFDLFLIDLTLDSNLKVDSMSFIKGQALLRKLSEFGRPIVSVGAANFQDMEFLSKAGIRYFTNDFIGKESKMLLPVEGKVIKKVNSMVK